MGFVVVLGAERSGVAVVSEAIAEAAGVGAVRLGNASGPSGQRPVASLVEAVDAAIERPSHRRGHLRVFQAEDSAAECPNSRAAQILLDRHSDLRAVFVWRRGVDFINSRLRAFPSADFVSHCRLWANAIAQGRQLQKRFGSRLLLVEHGALRSRPEETAEAIAHFLPDAELDSDGLLRRFGRNGSNRTVAIVRTPVVDPAKTGWSMAEVETFLGICGAAVSATGESFDIGAAERRRPIDIADAMLRRGAASGGFSIREASRRQVSAILAYERAAPGEEAAIRLSAVPAGGRHRLGLRLELQTGVETELRCSVVESLSRRRIFARILDLKPGQPALVDEILPRHGGLLEISFLLPNPAEGGEISIAVRTARLARD